MAGEEEVKTGGLDTEDLLDLGMSSTTVPVQREEGKSIEILDIEEDYDPSVEQSQSFRDQQWDRLGANRHDVAYD